MMTVSLEVQSIARALRERRLSLGSQATLQAIAHRAHISMRHLHNIENGTATPRLATVLALTEALRTDLQSVLDRAEVLRHRKADVAERRADVRSRGSGH